MRLTYYNGLLLVVCLLFALLNLTTCAQARGSHSSYSSHSHSSTHSHSSRSH
jgi:hypothetical protein